MKRAGLKYLIIIAGLLFFSQCTFEGTNPISSTDSTAPNTPTPENGAVNQSTALQLKWNIDQAVSYDIYLGTTNPPTTAYATGRTSPYITVAGLKSNTTYYWQVVAHLSDGTTKTGPVWSFTTSSGISTQEGYLLIEHKVFTQDPSYVNIWFQVLDYDGKGIHNLTTSNFRLLEDGKEISQSESKMEVIKKDDVQYVLKVVLMLDNSTSIGSDISEVKSAANQFVSNLIPGGQTQVAIYTFSDKTRLIQDFTDNIGTLQNAIAGINIGYATTDLFGAVIDGVSKWTDTYDNELTNIEQGALVLFTDGTDTQGRHTLSEAIGASQDKRVYTIGLGTEISPDTLDILGNAGFYSAADASGIADAFLNIQQELIDYGNSFYWLRYLTPKRGPINHIIELSLIDNLNTGAGSSITGSFYSTTFYDTDPGLYINANAANPFGIDTVFVGKLGSTKVTAQSMLSNNDSQFLWSPADTNIAVVQMLGGDNSEALITAKDSSAVTNTLIIDQANPGYSKRLYIKVR